MMCGVGEAATVVDIGNTAVKVWQGTAVGVIPGRPTYAALAAVLRGAGRIVWWATGVVDDDVRRLLGPYEVCGTTPGVIDNDYLTPETLGPDRWAGINGAFALARRDGGGTAVLVIDAGTALTYDFATDFTPLPDGRFDRPAKTRGTYYGGGIAPGIAMRYRALHEFTARLPMLKPDDLPHAEFGRDTLSSLRFGVQGAAVLEAQAVVERTLARLPHGATLDVFLTGGDGPFLHKTMQNRNFASRTLRPDLAAYGARLLFPN